MTAMAAMAAMAAITASPGISERAFSVTSIR
jgi:hypothetical protein